MERPRLARHGVLVFEPEHGGHQPAYVRMLAEWIAGRKADVGVTFAVSGQLLERLQVEDRMDLRKLPGVTVHTIDTDAAQSCFHGPLYRRSFARMQLIRKIVNSFHFQHVVTLYLDSLQLSLALGQSPGPGTTLSGILFRPSLHAIYSDSTLPPLSEQVRDWRKRILYRLMLRNPALTQVFSLDPYFPAYAASEFALAEKVVAIADPAVSGGVAEGAEIGPDLIEALAGQNTSFTLFGALSERKGVCQVLDAVSRLTAATRENIRVVLAGRVDSALRSEVRLRMDRLASPAIGSQCVRILDRYLTTEELAWLVRESTVILAPYQRFVGSSGVLTWAAAQRRPVIAQHYGLVGALVRDYRLGLAVDTSDPTRIAESIAELADADRRNDIVRAARWSEFLAGKTGADFATRLLGDLIERDSR